MEEFAAFAHAASLEFDEVPHPLIPEQGEE